MPNNSSIYRCKLHDYNIILNKGQMKKLFAAMIFAACLLVACDGQGGSGVYTISVDKNQIEADGKDIATFTIKDSEGTIVTTEANAGSIFFKNVADDTRLPRYSTGFTSVADGEYEFVGIYNGVETTNSVKITVVNRAKYEVFHRNVAIFKLTGTWCQNCPRMTAALHSLGEDAEAHSIVLACHNEETTHPFYVNFNGRDLASAIFLEMGETSSVYPTNCYDMAELNTSSSVLTISDVVMNRRIESPACAGVKITSFQLEGTTLKVKATVKSSAAGTFDMSCAILGDNLQYQGGFADNDEGLYDNVVIAVSGDNFLSCTSKTSFELAKGDEYERTFEFAFQQAPSKELLENMSAVVLVHKKNADNSSEVNNCAECAYGSSVDYKYN